MKKNLGAKLALYPTPLTVIGAMDGDKPTWTLVAYVGILGHDRLLVSLAGAHAIRFLESAFPSRTTCKQSESGGIYNDKYKFT